MVVGNDDLQSQLLGPGHALNAGNTIVDSEQYLGVRELGHDFIHTGRVDAKPAGDAVVAVMVDWHAQLGQSRQSSNARCNAVHIVVVVDGHHFLVGNNRFQDRHCLIHVQQRRMSPQLLGQGREEELLHFNRRLDPTVVQDIQADRVDRRQPDWKRDCRPLDLIIDILHRSSWAAPMQPHSFLRFLPQTLNFQIEVCGNNMQIAF